MKPLFFNYKPASRAIRKLAGTRGMYNDRLADGARSYKIQGWRKSNYQRAGRELAKLGYTVTVHNAGFQGYWGQLFDRANRAEPQYRLHVR